MLVSDLCESIVDDIDIREVTGSPYGEDQW
jgi:hypothetical protein